MKHQSRTGKLRAGKLVTTVLDRAIPFDFGAVTVLQQDTTNTNALGPDGYTWAQAYQPSVDQYGKIATLVQKNSAGLYWLLSNDSGATWQDILDSPGDGVYPVPVTRHAMAYDSVNDVFHVLYLGLDPGDGMIYRRYTPTRDASNNITDITKDANTNIQFDITNGGTMTYLHPIVLFFDNIGSKGAVVCIWGARNSGVGGGMELRATMRILTNDSNDGNIANWTHIGIDSTTTIGNAPQVDYTALVSNTSAAAGGHASVMVKAANSNIGDLYIFYDENITGTPKWRFRRAEWNGSNAWTTLTTAVDIGNHTESGTNGGYNLKGEIGSKPVEDTKNDLVFFGYSAWKSNTDGDTWQFKYVDSSDTVSAVQYVYYSVAANNHQDIFITGDLMFDRRSKLLIVTYTDLPNKDVYAIAYKKTAAGMQAMTEPKLLYTTTPADIPVLLGTRINNRFVVIMRDFNTEARNNPPTYTPPYTGYFITVKQR